MAGRFVNSLVYYGLSLSTGQLGGNDYVNFLVSGLVEVPAYVFCQFGLGYIGRRGCLTGTMVAGGLCLLVIIAIPKQPECKWNSPDLCRQDFEL